MHRIAHIAKALHLHHEYHHAKLSLECNPFLSYIVPLLSCDSRNRRYESRLTAMIVLIRSS